MQTWNPFSIMKHIHALPFNQQAGNAERLKAKFMQPRRLVDYLIFQDV